MPRTLQEILDHAEELADYFEQADPDDFVEVPPDVVYERRLAQAALARARAEERVADAVHEAHDNGLSWTRIGKLLGTSPQSAHKRYARGATK